MSTPASKKQKRDVQKGQGGARCAGITQFYSRTKSCPSDGRNYALLSNFTQYEDNKGQTTSVEFLFQIEKLTCDSSGNVSGRKALELEITSSVENSSQVKRLGSSLNWAKYNLKLDRQAWEKKKDGVMKGLIQRRLRDDPTFRDILTYVMQGDHPMLLHFERSGAKSYWGGSINEKGEIVGVNRLGKIMMEVWHEDQSKSTKPLSSDSSE